MLKVENIKLPPGAGMAALAAETARLLRVREKDLLSRTPVLYGWGIVSGLVYGLILNGYHVLGYVQPLTWPAALAACAASLPLDVTHGAATAVFLAAIWLPWGRAIRRVVAKYDL